MTTRGRLAYWYRWKSPLHVTFCGGKMFGRIGFRKPAHLFSVELRVTHGRDE